MAENSVQTVDGGAPLVNAANSGSCESVDQDSANRGAATSDLSHGAELSAEAPMGAAFAVNSLVWRAHQEGQQAQAALASAALSSTSIRDHR
jgi:hypothetical protein